MRFRGFRSDGNCTRENLFSFREMSAIKLRYAQQMQRIKLVWKALKDLPAKRLCVSMLALAIGSYRKRQKRLRLLLELLLQPCVLKGSRSDLLHPLVPKFLCKRRLSQIA